MGLIGLGFTAVVAFWASANLITVMLIVFFLLLRKMNLPSALNYEDMKTVLPRI